MNFYEKLVYLVYTYYSVKGQEERDIKWAAFIGVSMVQVVNLITVCYGIIFISSKNILASHAIQLLVAVIAFALFYFNYKYFYRKLNYASLKVKAIQHQDGSFLVKAYISLSILALGAIMIIYAIHVNCYGKFEAL